MLPPALPGTSSRSRSYSAESVLCRDFCCRSSPRLTVSTAAPRCFERRARRSREESAPEPRIEPSPLALRAPEGRAAALGESAHDAATALGLALLAFAGVDVERVLDITRFAVCMAQSGQRAAAG